MASANNRDNNTIDDKHRFALFLVIFQGSNGARGPPGSSGATGVSGSRGPSGEKGEAGRIGESVSYAHLDQTF